MKKTLNIVASFGAAVVIFGAWAKLLHKPYADFMLTCGLLTEALIFILYGIIGFSEKEETHTPQSTSNSDELTDSIKTLNSTIKKIFKTY